MKLSMELLQQELQRESQYKRESTFLGEIETKAKVL
jgi:hypothetical protein